MSDSYVTSKATLKCSFGDKTSKLTVYPDRTVELTTKPTANISDHISMYNIAPFGKCHTTCYPPTGSATAANHGHLTPMPCVPGTDTNWINGKDDYIIKGNPALLKSSYCRCKWGGVITITDDGQIDTGSADLSRENAKSEEEMKAETEEKQKIEPESVLDGIQLALDAAGLAPGVGAIPDLLNASIYALRGDWGAAGLSVLAAVPIIGDAATAAKFAQKGVKAAKAVKQAEKINKTTDIAKGKVTSLSEFKSAKTKKDINNSDNVYSFPDKKHASTELSKNKVVQKQNNVVRIDKYERKVEKQANGPDKVTVTKKTDTIVAMDNNNRVNSIRNTTGNFNFSQQFNQNNNSGKQSQYNYGLQSKSESLVNQLERKKTNAKKRLEEAKKTLAKWPNSDMARRAVKNIEDEIIGIEEEIRKSKYGF